MKNVTEEVWEKDIHAHIHTHMYTHIHIRTCILTSWTCKGTGKKNQESTGHVKPGLKMPAYTKRVNKTNKSFKRSTTRYTKADNTLYYSTNSHFLKKEVKSKQKHPRRKKGAAKN